MTDNSTRKQAGQALPQGIETFDQNAARVGIKLAGSKNSSDADRRKFADTVISSASATAEYIIRRATGR